MKSYALPLLSILFACSPAYCGTASGKITMIYAHEKVVSGIDRGIIIFNVENRKDIPAIGSVTGCAASISEWAFDSGSDHGKAMYAMLLAASSQGKPVFVQGSGDCKDIADRERPRYISIQY